jgi:hypothetical protein
VLPFEHHHTLCDYFGPTYLVAFSTWQRVKN